jgi:hypothetical protein
MWGGKPSAGVRCQAAKPACRSDRTMRLMSACDLPRTEMSSAPPPSCVPALAATPPGL